VFALSDQLLLALGTGYRVAWTASERVNQGGQYASMDNVATGPVFRFSMGLAF